MSIKQRLYPDEAAAETLNMHARHARAIYNLGNEQRRMWRRGKQSINFNEQCRQLTELRKEEDWLRAGSQQVQSSALRDLDQAWKNFFQNPSHYRKPDWRKAVEHEAFVIQRPSVKKISRKWGAVFIPKHGFVKFRLTRPFREVQEAKSARVKFKAGCWHISFTALPREFTREETGGIIGFDMGVKQSVTMSDGEHYDYPQKLSEGEQVRFNALDALLNKQWGPRNKKYREAKTADPTNTRPSKRYLKTKRALAELHDRGSRRTKDAVEKLTTWAVQENDVVLIEDLNTKGMTKSPAPKPDPENEGQYLPNRAAAKAGLNKGILENAWGLTRKRLEDKASACPESAPVIVHAVKPAGTSQECRKCHFVSPENRESQAVFKCKRCGHKAHADVNAAKVIEYRGLLELGLIDPEPEWSGEELVVSDHNTGYAVGHTVNGRSIPEADATLTPATPPQSTGGPGISVL